MFDHETVGAEIGGGQERRNHFEKEMILESQLHMVSKSMVITTKEAQQHFSEAHAETVHIRAGRVGPNTQTVQLGGVVARAAQETGSFDQFGRCQHQGGAGIDQLDDVVGENDDVFQSEAAVHHVAIVQELQCLQHVHGCFQRQHLVQILALFVQLAQEPSQ